MSVLTGATAPTATERVHAAYRRLALRERPEAWIHLREERDVLAEAAAVEQRLHRGDQLPLAGATVAVKDNIDVAGLPTTAACPAFAYLPKRDAAAVARLRAAGAIVLGKTNLDQFATGLAGTRSPYGAVRDARDPARVAGGSSSGSAVAVALGIADIGLVTDTAGSGRVPASFQGIVGIKPTPGLVPTTGVVPASASFDCVGVLARDLAAARRAMSVLSDSRGRPQQPSPATGLPRLAIAARDHLTALSPGMALALTRVESHLARALGAQIVTVDLRPFLDAGALLYGGALVAERYAAVGRFISANRAAIDPSVAEIVLGARSISLADQRRDRRRLRQLRATAMEAISGCDALLLPTVPFQPTISEVARDPLGVVRQLGRYTTHCNVLGMCALSLPAGEADGGWFGITFYAPGGEDEPVARLAARIMTGDRVLGAESGPDQP
jgi:allophanate hydrolase